MKKFALSYSCGKDSTLALDRLIKRGFKPVALIVTINKEVNRSWFHGIPEDILEDISKSLGIEIIKVYSYGEDYEKSFEEGLKKAKEKGADFCAFGDIDIEDHRIWCKERCKNTNLKEIFPLWKEDRESITKEFVEEGFKGIIKACNDKYLNESFLGEILTKELICKIKKTGADPCGENGEYHTFVFDGPIFKKAIKFKLGEKFKNNEYNHLIIYK